jgi:hypothetical protein
MQKLSEEMAFDYEIVPPTTGRFGKRISDKKWDGVIGDLYTGVTNRRNQISGFSIIQSLSISEH